MQPRAGRWPSRVGAALTERATSPGGVTRRRPRRNAAGVARYPLSSARPGATPADALSYRTAPEIENAPKKERA